MAIKKSVATAGPIEWTVAELGAFYTEHRSELLAHANRVLKDSAKAEEITQDALIKFMLAAPELESTEHAVSYLHRTIENLCIDLFRLEGRRPNLVLLDDATAEVEAAWQVDGDHSTAISAAEDAAIIRQALAMLSPSERAAIVMWEMEGRTTSEIAAELGIKESAVRHTVSRARASLRRVLSELIIDEERGLTALDLLSTSYKKAAVIAQKSSKVALSLILVVTAFLGFNSLTGNEGSNLGQTTEIASAPVVPGAPTTESSEPSAVAEAAVEPSLNAQLAIAQGMLTSAVQSVSYIRVADATRGWQGLDAQGVPVGVTSNAGQFAAPKKSELVEIIPGETVFVTDQYGVTTYIPQTISITNGKVSYDAAPMFNLNGVQYEPEVLDQSIVILPSYDGGSLISAFITLANTGSDVQIPNQVNVRINLSADGSIISESAQLTFLPTSEASL